MNALWGLLPFFLALLGLVPPLFLKGKERLSLLNHFPSETLREEPRKVRAIFLILSTLALFLFLIVPLILLGETSEGGTRSFLLLFVFLEALYASGYLGISVYHPSENRLHFASLGALSISGSLLSLVQGLYVLAGRDFSSSFEGCIAGASFLFLFAILPLLPLLDPRLRSWSKLEAEAAPDGSHAFVRPKRILLAIVERILPFLHLLSELLFILLLAFL